LAGVRFLVTGATGKIGNAVARQLIERGDDVAALVRDTDRARELLPAAAELFEGDVTEPATIAAAAAGVDGAFNCMGIYEQWLRDPTTFDRVNAEGAAHVVAAARESGASRVVHTSTFDVFHAEPGGTVTEDEVASYPKGTAYERSKQHAEEQVLDEANRGRGIEVVIVNPASVYGPGPWASSGLDSAFRDAIRRRLPACPPGGMTTAFIDDVAGGHTAAFDSGRPGERYILADGYATVRDLCRAAVEEAGRGFVPPVLPRGIARAMSGAGEAVSRLIRRPPILPRGQLEFLQWEARADSLKAQRELGFNPIPWQEGVKRTVRWMIETGRV
jgi:nucleoside-diphosphate-sugar epimerase